MAVDVKKVMLQLGEENLKVVIKEIIKPLAVEMIEKSATPIDNVLLPFVDQIEAALLQLADKIAPDA